jgi:site-specific DNA-adenine methylase
MSALKAPFPWMGGKSSVAEIVWQRFGDVRNYCEPFFGSGAMLLSRPKPIGTETVNDVNGWLCNFWRALQADPEGVARYADWPVSELDLHARGDWLFYRPGVEEWIEKMRADPEFYDVKSAGWWVWGCCCWIGTGWGPMMRAQAKDRQLPHLGDAGMGVNRKRPHLGDAGMGEPQTSKGQALLAYLQQLAERLRGVRVCCGDWSRICGPTPTVKQGITAMFLDPPYGVEDRDDCYDSHEDYEVSAKVREWALQWQDDPRMRIALCGYEGEHDMPASWECMHWKARGGFGSQSKKGNDNCKRERIWFSPHCLKELSLFSG